MIENNRYVHFGHKLMVIKSFILALSSTGLFKFVIM